MRSVFIKKTSKISPCRLIFALSASSIISFIALICPPLDKMNLSPLKYVLTFVIPFAALFLFFALLKKPEKSIYRSVKYLYCILSPFAPIMLSYIFFDPNLSAVHSNSFFTRFLPLWAAVWWIGIAAVYAVLRVFEYAADRCCGKNVFFLRLIRAVTVIYTPQMFLDKRKGSGKSNWAAAAFCMLITAVGVLLGTVALYLYCVYSNMKFEAILFTMRFAEGGLAIEDIIAGTAIFLIFASITVYFCFHIIKCFRNDKLVAAHKCSTGKYALVMNGRKRAVIIVVSAVMLISC